MTLAEYLKEKRELRGLSKRALGLLAEVSHTEIYRIETGERINSSATILCSIADALYVPKEDILMVAGYLDDFNDGRTMVEKAFPALKSKEEQEVIEKVANILLLNPSLTKKEYEKIITQVEMVVGFATK